VDQPESVDLNSKSSDDEFTTDDDEDANVAIADGKPKKKVKSDRAKKWKDRLKKKSRKGGSENVDKDEEDDKTNTAQIGGDAPYPRVLYNDEEGNHAAKEPEIGSI
jgi:hypothetical protein